MEKHSASGGLRVLHVLAPGEAGGLERVVQGLSRAQADRGHEVHVAATLDNGRADHPFLAPLRNGPIAIHPAEIAPRAYHAEVRFLRRLLARLDPHVVHTHGYRADVVAGWVARRDGRSTVTTVHGFTGGGWKNRFYEWLQRRSHRRFDAVVAVSRPLADELRHRGVAAERLHLVPNGWWGGGERLPAERARQALGIAGDTPPVVGWVGRLSREKGADILLEALAELSDVPLRVAVVGEGKEAPALRERAKRLGVAGRVTWCGRVPEAGRLFPAFDLFVLSSRTEGTPMVLFEAMEAGVPIVATRVGGVPDVLSEEEGWLVPAESARPLAAAVREALGDPTAVRARAGRARERLRREFDAGPWAERYLEIYRSVRTGPPAARPVLTAAETPSGMPAGTERS